MASRADRYHGILAVNKPTGMSSHDVVQQVRRIVNQRSVGHTGTLDPAAEGLLLLCLGKATKLVRFLTAHDKCYVGEVTLGRESTTYDAEGVDESVAAKSVPELNAALLDSVLREFEGTISQRVPAYSAVRVNGERLYDLSRRGVAVEAPVREVNIEGISLLAIEEQRVKIEVRCGAGTYIRSLAHDIGQRLGCGGYLSSLTRTSIGNIRLDQALALDDVADVEQRGELARALVAVETALDFSTIAVRDDFRPRVLNGVVPTSDDVAQVVGEFSQGDHVLITNGGGTVLAIGTARVSSAFLRQNGTSDICAYDRVLI
ncbi:MAG: tRNA pseudouridine(55) synthase TruB [candidate division Zixibacteria bacterium]|nr:tRNA pseudouridine(55) synthase TruB [candidate division Zixibacteria bacterium]